MNDLEDHIAGLAKLIAPAQRSRYRTLLASARGREKIRTIDLRNHGELPFDERHVTVVTGVPTDRLARRLERLNAASDVCLWTENDAPGIVSLRHVFDEYLGNGHYTYAISIVAGEIAFLERAEYPATRMLVIRPPEP